MPEADIQELINRLNESGYLLRFDTRSIKRVVPAAFRSQLEPEVSTVVANKTN